MNGRRSSHVQTHTDSAPFSARIRRRYRPRLQQLESRELLTNLTYHGGPVLTQIDVQPIYFGSYWNNTANGQQNVGALQHFLSDIVNNDPGGLGEPSLFLYTPIPALDPYGTAGSGGTYGNLLSPVYDNMTVAWDQQIDDSYIRSILPNSPNANRVDLFLAPPGSWVSAGQENSLAGPGNHFLGYHSYEIGSNGVPIYYMVIVYPGSPNFPENLSPFNQLTVVISHELAETITDPQFTGWYDNSLGLAGETGDVCPGPSNQLLFQPTIVLPDVYLMQAVWYNQNGLEAGHPGLPGLHGGTYDFSPHPLSQSFTAAIGQSTQALLANFTQAGSSAGDFAAQINWGDGTVSNGQVTTASDGSFNVEGTHSFATMGDFLASVTITNTVDGTSTMTYPDFAVSSIQLTLTAPAAFAGVAFDGAIGTFSDSGSATGTYLVTIDWGDGDSSVVDVGPNSTSNGVVTANGDGTFTISGAHTYTSTGSYTITYSLSETTSGPAPITVRGTATATVTNPTPPSVASQSYPVTTGSSLTVDASGGLLAGSSDPQGLTLTAKVVTPPAYGVLTLAPDGSFSYTPSAGFQGTDSFSFDATDGVLTSSLATVTFDIGKNPVAVPDAYWHLVNQPVTIGATAAVLANDTDPQNLPLTAQLATPPGFGQVVLQPDGAFTYTPTPGYTGTDFFTYTASDGTFTSAPASVTIAAGVAPAAVDHAYNLPSGMASTIAAGQGLLSHDVDPNGLPLQAELAAGPTSGGSITVSPDGSFTVTPDPGFAGKLTFTYRTFDAVAGSNTATVTVNLVNPPVASNHAYSVVVGRTLHVPAPGLLGDDTDPSGLPLTIGSHTSPTFGTLTMNPDGSFDYTPGTGLSGTDSFTYVATDGLASSASARVDITIEPPPPPIASNHSYTTVAGQTLHVPALGLLAGDTDPSGMSVFLQSHGTPAFGTVTVNSDGSFDYTPFPGLSGTDSFTYTIADGNLMTATGTVSITIQPRPATPPPQVARIEGLPHSRKGLTTISVVFDQALGSVSAQDGKFSVLLGVTKRRHLVFDKFVGIRSIAYGGNADTVNLNLARPVKGVIQVTVYPGIAGADSVVSTSGFSTVLG